jgi:peptidoglycan/LPS O-acetylase OafA/YrhL
MKQKNGKIEIMRFIFSVIIILFHCHRSIGFHHLVIGQSRIPVLNRGYFGVEFFFVISGLLMAKSIHNCQIWEVVFIFTCIHKPK